MSPLRCHRLPVAFGTLLEPELVKINLHDVFNETSHQFTRNREREGEKGLTAPPHPTRGLDDLKRIETSANSADVTG